MFEGRPLLRQYAVVTAVNLATLSAGLGFGWPSPALVKLTNGTDTGLAPISEEEGSWIVALPCLFSIFPNFIAAYVMDSIGRKRCLIWTCILKTLACFLQTFASEVWMLFVARSALGALDAVVFCCVPAYASEVANKEIRGALGAILNIFCTFGMVLLLSAGPFISYYGINIFYTVVTFAGTVPLLFLPESPYFLYSKGLTEESYKVLTHLRGSIQSATDEIKEYIPKKDQKTLNIFTNKTFLRSLTITTIFSIIGQMACHNCVMAYLQTILDSTNTTIETGIASVVVGCIGLLASFGTMFTDMYGRKPILIVTQIISGLSMLGLGAFFQLKNSGYTMVGAINFIPVASLVMFFFSQSLGFASIYMIVISELFDGPTRAVGMAISLTTSSITVFITSKYFSLLLAVIGAGVYWIIVVFSIITAVFVAMYVPETKGRSFREIQECLGG